MESDKSSDSPNKRKRGRPLKDSGSSSVSEERRLQVRKAQEAYRRRKEVATKQLEQRVVFLEESLEDISNAFIDFTESMLKAEAIRRNPEILQNLLTTTSSITRLAKTAAPDPIEAPKDDYIRPSREELVSGTGEHSSSSVPESSGGFDISASRLMTPSGLSPKRDIFGNGWFGLEPSLSHISIRGASPSDPDGDFASKLIETTLKMAYNSLVEYSNDPTSFIMRMCRYALLYHSMEEVLFNLRWFLGPGFLAMESLCRANFGFDHTLSVQSFNTIASSHEAKVFSPFIDAQALVESQSKIPRLAFMNALDVEGYLKSKGAVNLDQDIVQIQIHRSSEAESMERSLLDSYEARPKVDLSANDQYFNPILGPREKEIFGMPELTPMDSYFASNSSPTQFQTSSFLGNGVNNPSSNAWINSLDLFDFNSLLESPGKRSRDSRRHISARPRTVPLHPRTVTLSRSSLLDNLAACSLCLGTGPAFPRASVDMAIEAAIC